MWKNIKQNLKSVYRSLKFKVSDVQPGLTLRGTAADHLDTTFLMIPSGWEKSYHSYRIVVDTVQGNQVAYYSWYVDNEGNEFIQGTVKLTHVNEMVRRIRTADLIVVTDK